MPLNGSLHLLRNGAELTLSQPNEIHTQDVADIRVECQKVTIRNWSRVAVCHEASGPCAPQLFLKQFVDSKQIPHPDQYHNELDSIKKAIELFEPDVSVLRPKYLDPKNLTIAYEYIPMLTLDEILRNTAGKFSQPTGYEASFEIVLNAVSVILNRLRDLENASGPNGSCGTANCAYVFHGFDARNIGVPTDLGLPGASPNAYLFDLGNHWTGPRQEASARYLTTLGLLNWGKPLSRFALGPDTEMLANGIARIHEHISKKATIARINGEFRSRIFNVQGPNWMVRLGKRAGLLTVGYYYIRRLRHFISNASIPD